MKLKYTILYVEDVSKTLKFYEAAFGFSTRFLHEAGDYGELNTGSTTLSFSSLALMTELGKTPGKASPKSPTFEIAFETDDVESWFDRAVNNGAKPIQAVQQQPWGQYTSYVSDPNGFIVEICSPVSTNN